MGETTADFELEGNGAPHGPPPLGKYGCARARFGWEKGDDEAPHLVVEFTDAVLARRMLHQMPSARCGAFWRSGVLFWACGNTVGGDRGEEAAAIKPECTPIFV